ncbi:MAG: terminase family protein, partial [Pseudomonadota bacterium]
MPTKVWRSWLQSLLPTELEGLLHDWPFWARPDQLPPADEAWTVWLLLGGRGAGKTRAGAEWVRALAEAGGVGRIALVGETYGDVRSVMIEGESGLLAIAPDGARPTFLAARRRLEWPNGVVAEAFSSEDPDGLRGPQFAAAWSDEICKWAYPEETWSNLQLALRLGDRPRQVVTTTPRPTALLKRLMEKETTRIARASTYENRANLARSFLTEIVSEYEGTRLGRQELMGEVVDDVEGALWTWSMIEAARISAAPELSRIVVAVDPPASAGPDADECGVVVAGRGEIDGDPVAFVLADRSAGGPMRRRICASPPTGRITRSPGSA